MSIIDLNTADIFNAIGGGSPLSIIDSVLHPQYVIRNSSDDTIALEFSGMASLQSGGRASITNAPIEGGAYQSINKVKDPGRVRCSIIVGALTGFSGNIPDIFDFTLVSQFGTLGTIKGMIDSANTYNIETPKETLLGYDVTDYAYEVNGQKGVSLLVVHLDFQEVIQVMGVTLSGAQTGKQPTNDNESNSQTGVGTPFKDAGSKKSTLDELSDVVSPLQKSVGDVANSISDVTSGFRSALDTVNQTVTEVTGSAVKKVDSLALKILELTT
ncbi:hypothetical protein ACSFCW_16800 [Yokenella regensburgei]|uniref:hypothetical protein n=1 Tax=Yokenella regensburgei TaxID=158877 RepID=UPI003ED918D5